eukprot:scaffold24224_cov19-Tisochrysis_lutea.AAC.1
MHMPLSCTLSHPATTRMLRSAPMPPHTHSSSSFRLVVKRSCMLTNAHATAAHLTRPSTHTHAHKSTHSTPHSLVHILQAGEAVSRADVVRSRF